MLRGTSPCLIDAFIAIEDSRFWSHKGVDVRSMVRAAVGIITGDSSAGGGRYPGPSSSLKTISLKAAMRTPSGRNLERKIQGAVSGDPVRRRSCG
ncbi:MAG: transglycosylase domain-containing protein [Pilosibacter sp.]